MHAFRLLSFVLKYAILFQKFNFNSFPSFLPRKSMKIARDFLPSSKLKENTRRSCVWPMKSRDLMIFFSLISQELQCWQRSVSMIYFQVGKCLGSLWAKLIEDSFHDWLVASQNLMELDFFAFSRKLKIISPVRRLTKILRFCPIPDNKALRKVCFSVQSQITYWWAEQLCSVSFGSALIIVSELC